ncbi:hypothetical protein PVW53_05675 [Seohaeicola sp. SP36]|nr:MULTISPECIES: hypothetical protein [unclassified Seohaeicola]MDD9706765.1 hypothetical protein [Seohaeicola sp. 4SK31]MDD9735001.1 hypothetical protein [Seohaeicola sp. SP36]
MPWKPTDEMTRDELTEQLEQLRGVVERFAAQVPPVKPDDADLAPQDEQP